MMYNDAGTSGEALDPGKQMSAAVLCKLLGSAIELLRAEPGRNRLLAPPKHPVVSQAVQLLSRNPALGGKELARSIHISHGHFMRLFKSELGMSVVEYRNRLRIQRFRARLRDGDESLQSAALGAGFGSYAQFHRVFRAVYGTAPRSYFRSRA
jgi:transcriptional regulator GlxA family with amidase domain